MAPPSGPESSMVYSMAAPSGPESSMGQPSARSRAAKREQSARFPQSWGRYCDVRAATYLPVQRRGHPTSPGVHARAPPGHPASLVVPVRTWEPFTAWA
eukprot:gene12642-biopygen7597